MAKFHVNPETGIPGECSATQGKCPFGGADAHGSTPHEAVERFEASYSTLPEGKSKEQIARNLDGEIHAIDAELKELDTEVATKEAAVASAEALIGVLADFPYDSIEARENAEAELTWIIRQGEARLAEIEEERKELGRDRESLVSDLNKARPPAPVAAPPKRPLPPRARNPISDYSYNRKHGGKY